MTYLKKRKNNFLIKSKKVHGDKYDYSLVKYVNNKTPIDIICPEHGKFTTTPAVHIAGHSCKMCGTESMRNTVTFSADKVLKKIIDVHGDKYQYDFSGYKNYLSTLKIRCKKHGTFMQDVSTHLRGSGCRECSVEDSRDTIEDFILKSSKVHKGFYTYSKAKYHNTYSDVVITCPKHGDFTQRANDHVKGHGCHQCSGRKSVAEVMWQKYLDDKGIEYIENTRPEWLILEGSKGRHELDLYIPSLNLAIEINGNMWHSTSSIGCNNAKSISYHFEKYLACKANGITLIHIFQFESVRAWKKKLNSYFDNPEQYLITFKNNKRQYKEFDFYGQSFIDSKHLVNTVEH